MESSASPKATKTDLEASLKLNKGIWIFGYGSLTWKVDFIYSQRCLAKLSGYNRRFWQGSTDHRGVPGSPGRVVTIIPDEQGEIFGQAYFISAENATECLKHLDFREKGGYCQKSVVITLYKSKKVAFQKVDAIVYYADKNNPNFLGDSSLEKISQQILKSRGPSGPNFEYLFGLQKWLSFHKLEDAHISQIFDIVSKRVENWETHYKSLQLD